MRFKTFYFLEAINRDRITKMLGGQDKYTSTKKEILKELDKFNFKDLFKNRENDKRFQGLVNFLMYLEGKGEPLEKDLGNILGFFHDLITSEDYSNFDKITKDENTSKESLKNEIQRVSNAKKEKGGYNSLTPEEKIAFHKAEVVHEFADGFKWVNPTNEDGTLKAYCEIEGKVANHCGNVLGKQNNSDIIYSLRKGNEIFATVVVDKDGKVRESKAPYNQKIKKQYYQYIIWLYKQDFIKGVVDGGYAPHMDTSMSDFVSDDKDVYDWFMNNKKEMITTMDQEILSEVEGIKSGKSRIEKIIKEFPRDVYSLLDDISKYLKIKNILKDSSDINWDVTDEKLKRVTERVLLTRSDTTEALVVHSYDKMFNSDIFNKIIVFLYKTEPSELDDEMEKYYQEKIKNVEIDKEFLEKHYRKIEDERLVNFMENGTVSEQINFLRVFSDVEVTDNTKYGFIEVDKSTVIDLFASDDPDNYITYEVINYGDSEYYRIRENISDVKILYMWTDMETYRQDLEEFYGI